MAGPILLSLQLLSLMRAIAPQTPFPPNLPAWSPIRHRRFPKIASARNWPNLCVWISWGRFLDGFPCVGFRPLSPLCMKYSFPNYVWSAAYHTQMNPLNTWHQQLPLNFAPSSKEALSSSYHCLTLYEIVLIGFLPQFFLAPHLLLPSFPCFPPNPVNTLEREFILERTNSQRKLHNLQYRFTFFLKLSLCQINIDLNTIWTKAMHVRHATECNHCSTQYAQ